MTLTGSVFASGAEAHGRRHEHHARHETRLMGHHRHLAFHRVAGRAIAHHAHHARRFVREEIVQPPASAEQATASAASHGTGGMRGMASYYGGRGRTASNGHVGAATCAHRTLPFGTVLRVTNLRNSRSMLLTVNDRGPFVRGRIVDVSVTAAAQLDMIHSGTAPVAIQVVGRGG